MTSSENRSLLPLSLAVLHLAARRGRAALRDAIRRPDAVSGTEFRIAAEGSELTPADQDETLAAAVLAGVPRADARRALRSGGLTGIVLTHPNGRVDRAIGRVDLGTGTVDVHVTPLGTSPDPRAAEPLAAYARHRLSEDEHLRRVSVTVPAGHPVVERLVAAGFVDEGWAPPVGGWTDARLLTHLR